MKSKKVLIGFNNGSVPPDYAYRYELVLSENGIATLEVYRGFDRDEVKVFSETKNIDILVFEQLILEVINLKLTDYSSHFIGGAQRSIQIISTNKKKYFFTEDNVLAIQLFNRFLHLYDSDFQNVINKIINY